MAQVVIIQSFFFKQNLSLMILEVYLITKNHCLRIIVLFFYDEKKLQMAYKNPNK